jgi:demethylmenaquinone methyltransferase/2-methoxy-6-polyprenyl-1,4-benzoquinol methylase
MEEVKPYQDREGGKKEQVREMFNNISKRYDLLNHLLSLGIDRLWRKKSISYLKEKPANKILDIATGTGDFAIEALSLKPDSIVGVDISELMLEQGKIKIKRKGYDNIIELEVGDAENLRFEDETFNAATVGFGVRNFENLTKGLMEINRVLKKDSKLVVLEFSKPHAFPVKQLYHLYFNKILPFIGSFISNDSRAYSYLPESVNAFPEGPEFIEIMTNCGFNDIIQKKLMNGIASIYVGKK